MLLLLLLLGLLVGLLVGLLLRLLLLLLLQGHGGHVGGVVHHVRGHGLHLGRAHGRGLSGRRPLRGRLAGRGAVLGRLRVGWHHVGRGLDEMLLEGRLVVHGARVGVHDLRLRLAGDLNAGLTLVEVGRVNRAMVHLERAIIELMLMESRDLFGFTGLCVCAIST